MSNTSAQPIGQIQIPQCSICRMQPVPQSVQYTPFIMLEVFLAFISLKLAGIFLLFSYSFTRSAWYCPQCKREIDINHEVKGVSDNLIIRAGNCMFMLSKLKFRIIAILIASYLFYSYILEMHQKPQRHIEKTWQNLASNCGYEAYLENSYKANSIYGEYPQLGEWTIKGIYLRQVVINNKIKKLSLKMNPSQFKNPQTEDVIVVVTLHTSTDHQKLDSGDVLQVKGQWEGREADNHLLKFVALKIHKTGQKQKPQNVKLLPSAERFIKQHDEERGKNLAFEKSKFVVMNG